jgi:hypothetical protein
MIAKQRSDGRFLHIECSDGGEAYVILCGLTASGEVKPLRVDDDGMIIIST